MRRREASAPSPALLSLVAAAPHDRPLRCAAPLLLALAFALAACLPSTGHVEIYGDAVTSTEAGHLQLADGMPAAPDYGSGPRPEVGVKLDKGGVAPTAPQPPFGNQQGQTAKNVTGVPDCGGKLYNLYDYFNKTKGVVLPIMSPS